MPISWLGTLQPAQRESYPFVRRGVKESLSIAVIGRAIRNGGLAISNSVLSEMVRRERDIVAHVGNLRLLGPNRLPNPLKLPEALTRIDKRYSIEVKLGERYLPTGKTESVYATITSNTLLSNSMIDKAVDKIYQGNRSKYSFEFTGYELTAYMRAGDLGFGE